MEARARVRVGLGRPVKAGPWRVGSGDASERERGMRPGKAAKQKGDSNLPIRREGL